MSGKGLPPLLDRHWAESVLAIGAVVIAAVSLWVAYDTEKTDRELVESQRRLVAASSWPFVQVAENDQTPAGGPGLSLIIMNGGIGPAKVETFELFWQEKAQRNPGELLRACCTGHGQSGAASGVDPDIKASLGVSSTSGLVLRPGQVLPFIFLAQSREDAPVIDALRAGLRNISVRYCYCSAFDECWLATDHFGRRRDLNPPRVQVCPQPAVPYSNQGL